PRRWQQSPPPRTPEATRSRSRSASAAQQGPGRRGSQLQRIDPYLPSPKRKAARLGTPLARAPGQGDPPPRNAACQETRQAYDDLLELKSTCAAAPLDRQSTGPVSRTSRSPSTSGSFGNTGPAGALFLGVV